MIRFRCVVCGKETAGRIPVNPHNHRERGDGTLRYPRKHANNGEVCRGCYIEADWVQVSNPNCRCALVVSRA